VVWVHEVAGSNPVAPTILFSFPRWRKISSLRKLQHTVASREIVEFIFSSFIPMKPGLF
jgi:hypothetical protein